MRSFSTKKHASVCFSNQFLRTLKKGNSFFAFPEVLAEKTHQDKKKNCHERGRRES